MSVICQLFSQSFHALAWTGLAVENVIYHICDRHIYTMSVVDFFDARRCIISFRYHGHLVECALTVHPCPMSWPSRRLRLNVEYEVTRRSPRYAASFVSLSKG